MVQSSNSLVIHQDDLHTGSAKRAAANGLASLDAAGKVPIAEVGAVELTTNKNAASGYAGLDASILLALAQQRLNFYMGRLTKNTADASGDQVVTGVGFQPRLVIFLASLSGSAGQMSIGIDNGTAPDCIADYYNGVANAYLQEAGFPIVMYQTGAIHSKALITAFGADGFTLTWTKTGAKTGTCAIAYIAMR